MSSTVNSDVYDSIRGYLPSETSLTLSSPQEALGVLIHTLHARAGFRLASSADNVLPSAWSKDAPGEIVLEYIRAEGPGTFKVWLAGRGGRVVVGVLDVEKDNNHHLAIPLSEYIASIDSFPFSIEDSSQSSDKTNADQIGPLFVSPSKLQTLIELYQKDILSKLDSSQGEDQEESTEDSKERGISGNMSSSRQQPPYSSLQESRSEPVGNLERSMPSAPPYNTGQQTFDNPSRASIGAADLDPLAASPMAYRPVSTFPPIGGIGGLGSGGMNPQGGMYMDPSHPLFHPSSDRSQRQPGPFPGHPQGARFDPVSPFSGSIPGGGGGFGGGGPVGGGWSGEPDNDEFMPPGMGQNRDMGVRFPGQGGGNPGMGGIGGMGIGGMGLGGRPGRGAGGGFGGAGGGFGGVM
ncbi:PI31 proteasome regulator [Phaffia rhodozyma]|uniref:PI31 proteasome regulator n=1 Tax=Phaffia rhodozyma TaxID=264483 RepID=A0A0F7SRM9_PHARH|nr:PI31 proteasome regulator [Phaffia rhodozyma]